MKYYNSKYWEMMNADDPEEQDKGNDLWIESVNLYLTYFESIKEKLPKSFIKVFYKSDWFHDFSITNVNLINTGKYLSNVEIQIEKGDVVYKIMLVGVKRFVVNIPTTQNWLCGMLTWGYVEFEINNDNTWIIRILCDFDCEIEILFKRISIKKVK